MIQNKHKFAFLLCMLLMTTTVFGASEAEYKKLAKTWTLNADGSQEFLVPRGDTRLRAGDYLVVLFSGEEEREVRPAMRRLCDARLD